jgi:two-component system, OmpR family, response regulator
LALDWQRVRLLIVEDDRTIASFLVKGLTEAGFAVDQVQRGEDGLALMLSAPYDIAVIDLMLPGLDGMMLIEEMRRRRLRTPVIILSARRTVDDRVRGLQAGGDDYLTKPFAFSELLARVHALLRRSTGTVETTRLTVGDLTVDLLSRQATRGSRDLDLRPREFSLLEYLMRNPGRPVSKTLILQHVWNYDFDPQTNVVEVLVSRLRTKVDGELPEKMIHTIRGVGYVLRVP